jgi:hypothetical protein
MSRIEHFDGGWVTRREYPFFNGCYNTAPFDTTRLQAAYDRLWKMLVKRLRYGGNKARNARRRIGRIWGEKGLALAEAEVCPHSDCGLGGATCGHALWADRENTAR